MEDVCGRQLLVVVGGAGEGEVILVLPYPPPAHPEHHSSFPSISQWSLVSPNLFSSKCSRTLTASVRLRADMMEMATREEQGRRRGHRDLRVHVGKGLT